MALERLVSNKYFKGEYTNEEIRALFSQDLDIALGEIIIFNDKINPTIYFLDEEGKLTCIQKIPFEENDAIDDIISEIRALRKEFNEIEVTVINNKEELDIEIVGLRSRIELLEETMDVNVSPELLEQINNNTENIIKLNEKDINIENRIIVLENKLYLLEDIDDEINQLKNNDSNFQIEINNINDKFEDLYALIDNITLTIPDDYQVIEYRQPTASDIEFTSIAIGDNMSTAFNKVETNLSTLVNEVIENELVISEAFNVLNDNLENLVVNVEDIENSVELNLNAINTIDERLTIIEETGIQSINDKIELLEEGDIELYDSISSLKNNDIKDINTKILDLENNDISLSERVNILENIEPVDITPLQNQLDYLNNETSNLKGILSDLNEEVKENELVHSAGLNVLNNEIKDLKSAIENIDSGGTIVDLTEIEKKISDVEKDVKELDERLISIEEGDVDIDLTEIEKRIGDIEIISNTNKDNIVLLNEELDTLNTRIEVLENIDPVDLTEIENDITILKENNELFNTDIINLKVFDDNITETINSINSTASKALMIANEGIKDITPNENAYTSISKNINDRVATLEVIANVLDIQSSHEENDGLASSFNVKNELNNLFNTINNYNINGKLISENPVIGTNDLNLDDKYLNKKPYETQSILPNDELTLAIAKLEHKLDTIIEIFSIAINEINNKINEK